MSADNSRAKCCCVDLQLARTLAQVAESALGLSRAVVTRCRDVGERLPDEKGGGPPTRTPSARSTNPTSVQGVALGLDSAGLDSHPSWIRHRSGVGTQCPFNVRRIPGVVATLSNSWGFESLCAHRSTRNVSETRSPCVASGVLPVSFTAAKEWPGNPRCRPRSFSGLRRPRTGR